MQDVDTVAWDRPHGTKDDVAIISDGELVRIQTKVDLPEVIPRVAGHECEDCIQYNARNPPERAESEPYPVWTKYICGN